jgi:branched-subunit amino acid aminotransferase/4-amino-4-deoxychorismate lyase
MPDLPLPVAYLNGEFVPLSGARLPVYDLGIVQGATVTERLRTVRHVPYLVTEHLERLERTLAALQWPLPRDAGPLAGVIADVARLNAVGLAAEEDLSIVVFVTAGQALGDANGLTTHSRPAVCVYSAPLPLAEWGRSHREGVSLYTPVKVRQLPTDVVSPQLKHRSRLHWRLAEQETHARAAGAAPLLLDHDGYVTETSTGNLFVVRGRALLTPRAETTLPGIAQAHVMRLAERNGWEIGRADLTPQDVAGAEEAFLTSSTYCLLPVGAINGARIGTRIPGPVSKMLLDLWSQEIGLDLEAQALAAESRRA